VVVRCGPRNRKAADPGFGFRGLEAADAVEFQQFGGLQALVPGKDWIRLVRLSAAVMASMPAVRHITSDSVKTRRSSVAATAPKAWPHAGMPRYDGV
jgi:hypothetical protein